MTITGISIGPVQINEVTHSNTLFSNNTATPKDLIISFETKYGYRFRISGSMSMDVKEARKLANAILSEIKVRKSKTYLRREQLKPKP